MTDSTRPNPIRSAYGTLVLSLGVAVALWLLGNGALATPPIDSWTALRDWLADRSTTEAAIASLRAAGAVIALYLAIVSTLTIVAEATASAALARITRAVVPRSLHPLFYVAFGAGVATAAASLAVPRDDPPTQLATAMLHPPSDATATMFVVSATASHITTTTAASAPTATPIPPELLPLPADESIVDEHAPAPHPSTTDAPHTWTIAPGDHLWAVAAETLADAWRRAPTDTEVVPYWRDLIERNRSRLVDPSNPDYVLAGQVFELPEVPAHQ
jgi:hypothetical protein